MGELGREVIAALRDQGWNVIITDRQVYAESPAGIGNFVPVDIFQDQHEDSLRELVFTWQVFLGFEWPWPPDLRPEDFLDGDGGE